MKNQIIIIAYICSSLYSSILISDIFNSIYPKDFENGLREVILAHIEVDIEKEVTQHFEMLPIGKIIGILERSLIFFSILIFGFKGAGVIITGLIALKSLTRFKLLEIKIFSEYYLIGTLLSLSFSIFPFVISHFIPDKLLFFEKIINFLLFL